ncbi:hypothetical protein J132_03991, partial [Termitomyces sp. J132]
LTTCPLSCPIPVYNVDSMLNEAGSIHSVMDLVLHYKNHFKGATFAITNLGKQDMILRFTWLCEHNPEINWTKSEVKMSHCPCCCMTCAEEAHKDHRAKVVSMLPCMPVVLGISLMLILTS